MADGARRSSRNNNPPTTPAATQALQTLTSRELEILGLVATGQSTPSIARSLGIAPSTVKQHLKSTYLKLGAANRVQASNVYHLGHPQGSLPQRHDP